MEKSLDSDLYPWLRQHYKNLFQVQQGGRLPHALLFVGPSGIGKHELGRRLALSVLMSHSSGTSENRVLELFTAATHPDYTELRPLEDKTLISVEQVRDLIARLSLTAQLSTHKVALISPAEAMNAAAANALLKTLEEPAGDAIIILISHNTGLLPATVRSRCQRTVLGLPSREAALDWLRQDLAGDAERYLELANGSPVTARELYDCAMATRQDEVLKDLALLYQGRLSVYSVAQRWKDLELNLCIIWLRQLVGALIRYLMNSDFTSTIQSNFLKNLKISSGTIDLPELYRYLDYLNQASLELTANLNRELFMEQILSRWQALASMNKTTGP